MPHNWKRSICLAYKKRKLRSDLIKLYKLPHKEKIARTEDVFNLAENDTVWISYRKP